MSNKNNELTDKQRIFCLEYLKDFNGKQAAIRSGYSEKTAEQIASRLLSNVKVADFIKESQNKIEKSKIMDVKEIQERLTEIGRGTAKEDVVITENTGNFKSKARVVTKQVGAKDQVKALELLGKINSLFVEKVKLESDEVTGISIKFVNKSNKAKREQDPKIVGDYTPPSNTEET